MHEWALNRNSNKSYFVRYREHEPQTVIELGTCVIQHRDKGGLKSLNRCNQPCFIVTSIFLYNNKSCKSFQFTALSSFTFIAKLKTTILTETIIYYFITWNDLVNLPRLEYIIDTTSPHMQSYCRILPTLSF